MDNFLKVVLKRFSLNVLLQLIVTSTLVFKYLKTKIFEENSEEKNVYYLPYTSLNFDAIKKRSLLRVRPRYIQCAGYI